MIRVFQADDHRIVREGMRALISSEPDMEFVGEAGDGEEAIRKAKELKPDVILLDIQMPKMTGLEALPQLIVEVPDSKIIVITSFGDDSNVFSAIKAGALGYLLKDTAPDEIIHAIREVNAGRSSLHPSIALRVLQEINRPQQKKVLTEDPLTVREMEIVKYVAQGMTNNDIAELLVVSERTVRTHVSNILSKLHLANRTQAALYALREGLASLDEN